MDDRLIIFIDGGNFFHGIKNLNILFYNVDLKKFTEKISGDDKLIRVYYYTVKPTKASLPSYRSQMSFLDKLEKTPLFKVRYGRLLGLEREKGTDIYLAVDMLSLAYNNAYEKAILISGDGDYVEVISRIQQLGKQIINYSFEGLKSDHLLRTCDLFKYIKKEDINCCLKITDSDEAPISSQDK